MYCIESTRPVLLRSIDRFDSSVFACFAYCTSHSNRVELYGIDRVYGMEWNGVVLTLVLFVGHVSGL